MNNLNYIHHLTMVFESAGLPQSDLVKLLEFRNKRVEWLDKKCGAQFIVTVCNSVTCCMCIDMIYINREY